MANQSIKQQIANSMVQKVLQQQRDQGLAQLQADYDAWNTQQQEIAALQAEYDNWFKAQQPAQEAQPIKQATVNEVKEIPKLRNQIDLEDFFTPKTANGKNINLRKASKEDLNKVMVNDIANKISKNIVPTEEQYNKQKAIEENKTGRRTKVYKDSVNNMVSALNSKEMKQANALADYNKNVEQKAKVDQWLSPDYKLTDKDKEAAKKYAQEELQKYDYNSNKKPILNSAEDRQHYADMVNLLNKTNVVTNAMTGVIKQPAALGRAVRDAGNSIIDQLTGLGAAIGDKAGLTEGATKRHNEKVAAREAFNKQNDESMRQALANAKTQNPGATLAGEIGGQVGMYMLTNPAFDALGATAGLGKAGSFALNQVGQNAQDLALDTIPMLNDYLEGGVTNDERKELLKNIGLNAAGNLALGAAGEGISALAKNRAAKKAADAAFRANVSEGAEKLAKLADLEDVDNVVRNATRQAEEAAQNIDNIAKQMPEAPSYRPSEDELKGLIETVNPENDIEALNKEMGNMWADNAAETVEKAAKPQYDPEVQEKILSDFEEIYNSMDNMNRAAIDSGDAKALEKFEKLQQTIEDYENAIWKSGNPDEITKAKKAADAARQGFIRQMKKIDPNYKGDLTGTKLGNAEYRVPKGISDAEADELVQDWVDTELSNPNRYVEDVSKRNKVMAEDTGIEPTPEPQSVKETFEIPDTPENAPTGPKPTEVPPTNEGGDYLSKFRTHNEQNFNLTDEELNNKYFNTQNENFHFLKGDRAGDLEKATNNLETDYEGTLNRFLSKSSDLPYTPQEVDEGFMAWNKELTNARETGDYSKSAEIMYNLTKDSHDKAQGLQAYVAWKKNSPAGVVLDANEVARRMATNEFGSNYVKEIDNLTDKINDICKTDSSIDDKIKLIEKIMKDAKSKGYKKGLTGAEQMKELLQSGSKIDIASIHDVLCEANKMPNLSTKAQAEIGQLASEMYGRELTKSEKRKYINQINMILSREKHWTIKDKAIELTHILMLSGMRTHEKNFVANVGMLPQEALARKISAIGQKGYRAIVDHDYKPTQAFHVTKESKQLAESLYEAKGGADAIVEGVAEKYTGKLADKIGANYMFGTGKGNIVSKANQKALDKIPALKKFEDVAAEWGNKALKKMGSEGAYDAMDANASLLENYRQFIYGSLSGLEDNPFVKRNFVDRLASYIQAQGIKSIDDIPQEAVDIARVEALKATFKDDNSITELFSKIKKLPGIGELLLPFTKTPANLLARSIDFSPIGLARELYGAINKNSRFARETVGETLDEIAKGLGGTGTMLLGMYLYANGLITGKKSDNKDVANYMANEGWQEYSISTKGIADYINRILGTDLDLGDSYYDFSFLQPSTTNTIAGEEVWDELMDGKKITEKTPDEIFNRVKSISGSYIDALLAQSTMQNVSELFGSQYSDDGVGGNLFQNALEWPTRFTSGAINDITKLSDDTRREYYSKNKPLDTVKNAVMSKLPVLSEQLPAKYDVFGNEMTRNKSEGAKWINTLINPATTSHISEDPLYGYIDKLNEQSEQGDYVPKKFDRKIKLDNEEELSLDNKQYSELSRVSGETRSKLLEEIQKNDLYNSLSADEKVNILGSVEDIAKYNGYKAVADNAKITDEVQKTVDLYNEGGIKGLVDSAVAKSINKEYGLTSGSKAADAIAEKVAKGDITGARKDADLAAKVKDIEKQYGVSAGSNAAKEITAALEKGNTSEANKIAKEEANYNRACEIAGVTEKSSGTRKAYEEGGTTGLKEYVAKQKLYEKYDLENNSTASTVYEKWGEVGLQDLSTFQEQGIKGSTAVGIYQSAKSEGNAPSKSEFANTYKKMDSYGDSNGSVSQKEFIAYLGSGNYSEAQAQQLAQIYGDWSTIPKLTNKGWQFKKTKK